MQQNDYSDDEFQYLYVLVLKNNNLEKALSVALDIATEKHYRDEDIYNLALTNYKLDLALQIPIKKDYTDKDFEDIYKLALKTNEEIY